MVNKGEKMWFRWGENSLYDYHITYKILNGENKQIIFNILQLFVEGGKRREQKSGGVELRWLFSAKNESKKNKFRKNSQAEKKNYFTLLSSTHFFHT